MEFLFSIGILLLSYFLGSVPFGLIIVWLVTKKDIREVESGRTGGTNAMRAAGFGVGFATAMLDIGKSCVMVLLARWIMPESYWLHAMAPVAAILGHNYSIFLVKRSKEGKLQFRGGAGGAPSAGGALGLWWPSIFFIVPVGALLLYFVGYASIATLSAGVLSILIFGYRAFSGQGPWEYVLYGIFSLLLLILALRPNIKRLLSGSERIVGYRARKREESNR